MKSKSIIACILAAAVSFSLLTACGQDKQNSSGQSSEEGSKVVSAVSEEQSKTDEQSSKTEESSDVKESDNNVHTLTIRDSGKNKKMTAGFINTMSGASEEIAMTKTDEGADYYIYTCQADISKYNMVHLEYADGETTHDVAFNPYVSGWYLSDGKLRPYVAGGEPDYNTKVETKTFQFDGYDKNIYIWTPENYDPSSADKYATIYVLDGETDVADNIIETDSESWHTGEHITSMMSLTDKKAIVVGIDTSGKKRNDELIPDIGEFSVKNYPTKKRGNALAEFLCDTIVPYIQSNYNVYTNAEHTSVTGSSLGGLEAFYIAMEHPDKIGTAGAMSPSFWAYGVNTWKEWLMPKLSGENRPYIYLYGGDYEFDNGAVSILMNNALVESGYPKDRIVCSIYLPGEHLNEYWQDVFPEFLQAMFDRKVSALENGASVKLPEEAMKKMAEYQEETNFEESEPTDKDYVYYDNSETKWDKVCAYWWGPYGASTTKITSNEYYDHDWPGIEMERIEGTDIYRVVAPSGAVGIIFDNGVGDDEMGEGNVAYQTEDISYDKNSEPGHVYKIDMTQEAKQGKAKEKYKFRYPAGTWSDYAS